MTEITESQLSFPEQVPNNSPTPEAENPSTISIDPGTGLLSGPAGERSTVHLQSAPENTTAVVESTRVSDGITTNRIRIKTPQELAGKSFWVIAGRQTSKNGNKKFGRR